jgi:hypothetical protein
MNGYNKTLQTLFCLYICISINKKMTHTTTFLKTVLFSASLIITTTAFAQAKKAALKPEFKSGQKYQVSNTVKSSSSMEMMGQQMDMKGDVTIIRQLEIKDKKEKSYAVVSNISKMVAAMEVMGQNMNYDSEKKEDADSDMGKLLKNQINNPVTLEMSEEGKIIPGKKDDKKAADDAGRMAEMMKNLGAGADEAALTDDMFISLPKDIKEGDTWSDSIISEGQNTYRDYTVKSIQGKDAIVTISGKVLVNKKTENQGMEITIAMENKLTGELTVDTTTGVIKQRAITSEGSGNLEMMGTQVPMTTKVDTTSATTVL